MDNNGSNSNGTTLSEAGGTSGAALPTTAGMTEQSDGMYFLKSCGKSGPPSFCLSVPGEEFDGASRKNALQVSTRCWSLFTKTQNAANNPSEI